MIAQTLKCSTLEPDSHDFIVVGDSRVKLIFARDQNLEIAVRIRELLKASFIQRGII